ncbi:unnamed protein product [Clonostachys chloroleuca]|uniref:Cryparin n=1 Tax=Clonostachys chloroleuca TaxID=1926264 RepID=A0AA35M2S3_9HYPO|nr:unnamed protein product [Clonostachys chloroleuca]
MQPIEFEIHSPILVDAFIPRNTDIIINDGLVIHVTDAPVSLSTVVTDISTSFTTARSTASDNSFAGPYTTITVTDGTDGPHTTSYPPTNPDSSGTVIVQVPSFTGPYTTITITDGTGGTGGPTTGTFPPNPSDSTGTVIVQVPFTSTGDPSTLASATDNRSPYGPGSSTATSIDASSATDTTTDTISETATTDATTETTAGSTPTEAATTEAATTEAATTEAATTEAATTEAATTEAATTEAATTEAATTEAATTEAATTEAATTEAATTETATTNTTTPTSVAYESCPDSLYRSANCCSVDIIGVADIECDTPTETPTDAQSFSDICASVGKRARCCVLPLLGQALVCMTPVGVAN